MHNNFFCCHSNCGFLFSSFYYCCATHAFQSFGSTRLGALYIVTIEKVPVKMLMMCYLQCRVWSNVHGHELHVKGNIITFWNLFSCIPLFPSLAISKVKLVVLRATCIGSPPLKANPNSDCSIRIFTDCFIKVHSSHELHFHITN